MKVYVIIRLIDDAAETLAAFDSFDGAYNAIIKMEKEDCGRTKPDVYRAGDDYCEIYFEETDEAFGAAYFIRSLELNTLEK